MRFYAAKSAMASQYVILDTRKCMEGGIESCRENGSGAPRVRRNLKPPRQKLDGQTLSWSGIGRKRLLSRGILCNWISSQEMPPPTRLMKFCMALEDHKNLETRIETKKRLQQVLLRPETEIV
jgi:hypothetical protein